MNVQKRHDVVQPPEGSGFKYIALTQGQTATVDDSDYVWLMERTWHAWWSPATQSYYAVCSGPCVEKGKQEPISMGPYIKNAPKGVTVDHKDHDTLNYRRDNLRLATYIQNAFNRRKQTKRSTSSRFKGVNWHSKIKTWFARIQAHGKRKFLGEFQTEEAAGEAYRQEAFRLHGQFAKVVS